MDTGAIIALAAFILAALGALTAGVLRFGKVEAAIEEARDAKALAVSAKGELADFREKVARDYATADMVASVEGRVVAAIDRLGDRIDRILDARPAIRTTRTPK
jgi:hypothetical protein